MSRRVYTLFKRMLQKPLIPNGSDLNDYLTPGKYYLNALSNYTNAPSGYDTASAYMEVFRQYSPLSSNYTEQRLTLGGYFVTFARRWTGTAWSSWVTYAGSRDQIIAQGTSGIWSYEKYYSGKMKIRRSGYLTFTSGYVVVTLPTSFTLITDQAAAKSAIIMAQERYIGDNRTGDCVLNPSALSTATPHTFTIYGRTAGAQIAGSYYVDILIDGYYK